MSDQTKQPDLAERIDEELGKLYKYAMLPTQEDATGVIRQTLRSDPTIKAVEEALEFYADPESWFGAYCTPDSPIAEDWDKVDHYAFPDGKPGKQARQALTALRQLRGEEG